MRQRALFVLVGLLWVSLVMPASHAAFPGRNGKIAYVRHEWGTNDQEIYVINADGTGRRRLTKNRTSDIDPSFSSDGRLIVWACWGGNEEQADQRRGEICTMRADGTHKERITDDLIEDNSPSWSPGGRYIVFARTYKKDGRFVQDIYKMRRDGSGRVRLTTSGTNADPEWSPDGDLIAFWSQDTDGSIRTMRPDGSDQDLITANGIYPSWSPNGRKLVFERGEQVVVVDIASGKGQLVTGDYKAWKPAWSPDGDWILFTRRGDDLFKIRPDGTGVRRVTGVAGTSDATEVSPDWQAG